MRAEDITQLGGLLGYVTAPGNHPIWKLTDTGSAYAFFDREFPQLPIRECVSDESMERFVTERRIISPAIARMRSLVARVGTDAESEGSGVVLLGDCAHCIPGSTGQAMNAGLEDVTEFMKTLKESRREASVQELLRDFEAGRTGDVEALCELAGFSGQRFRQWGLLVGLMRKMDMRSRTLLANWFPRWCYPHTTAMLSNGWRYSVILKRFRYMSRLLVVGAVVLCLTLGCVISWVGALVWRVLY